MKSLQERKHWARKVSIVVYIVAEVKVQGVPGSVEFLDGAPDFGGTRIHTG